MEIPEFQERRCHNDRRAEERRRNTNPHYCGVERRCNVERRLFDRRQEDRARGRRRDFFREEQRKRVQECIDERIKAELANALYSPDRVEMARKQACGLKEKKDGSKKDDRERLAKSIAMIHGLNLNLPAATRIMQWEKEHKAIKGSLRYRAASQVAESRTTKSNSRKPGTKL